MEIFETLARLPAFNSFIPSKCSPLEQVWIVKGWKERNYLFFYGSFPAASAAGCKIAVEAQRMFSFLLTFSS